ncbi:IS1380 family transposase [Nocardia sp. NBC_01503]|uniref:IS1380 family transposase n=1 Tax=Nocardia sp. NBC_01503 TaxID=2975997 RepID=UPI002E7B11E3|nr:IS1380 family transposase [Nocardia sp. NBC_01503]WTL29472.1 IS1380 family transposase [Nocardia sp. NBC_01503]
MKQSISPYPRLRTDAQGSGIVTQAGAVLLLRTAEKLGLTSEISAAFAPWRKSMATHDPGKILLDLAVAVAIGGDCVADLSILRAEPGVFGPVASGPTVSRLITLLAGDAPKALSAIDSARARARATAWSLAGERAPDHDIDADHPLVIDLDATLVTAHSDKEHAAPTFKRGYGFHPLCAFIDHGSDGTGEPAAMLLRPGNAGANTAADHKKVLAAALGQLPWAPGYRVGRKVLVRTDAGGGTHEFVAYCHARRLQYSVGFGPTESVVAAMDAYLPNSAWTPAYDAEGQVRPGAWVAEITGIIGLSGWPPGMRVIVRKEKPHPGAQLRFTDLDGLRLTAFATNTTRGQLPDLELRHRRRARCEDRIRNAKDTGLRNLPFHDFAANRIWCAIVELALDLTAWLQLLALHEHPARRWEPKTLRLRLFSTAGRLARHARRTRLHLARHAPRTSLLTTAHDRLAAT